MDEHFGTDRPLEGDRGAAAPGPAAGEGPLVARALRWLALPRSEDPGADAARLGAFLWRELPEHWDADDREQHEVAWALGDHFAGAGRPDLAELCRSGTTHGLLAAWHRDPEEGARASVEELRRAGMPLAAEDSPAALRRRRADRWTASFGPVPAAFWSVARDTVTAPDRVPARANLSLAPAVAVLEALREPVVLDREGQLPAPLVRALDDRFRWSDDFPALRARGGAPIPPLTYLVDHLVAQRLLDRSSETLVLGARGEEVRQSTAALWWAVVAPSPRWRPEPDEDAVAVLAAAVLRGGSFVLRRAVEETAGVLRGKWRTALGGEEQVQLTAARVATDWYRIGVPLGWWDTGHGPASQRPNAVGRAATASLLRAVATRPRPRGGAMTDGSPRAW